MLLLEQVVIVVDDFVDLKLVLTLGQVPEHGKELLCQQVFSEKELDDLARPLNKLQVSLLGIPDQVEHAIFSDPFNECLA